MSTERRVIGSNLLDLTKLVVNLEKSHGPLGLSAATQAVISARVNLNSWYELAVFLDMMRAVERAIVKGSETRALELGAAGGSVMRGILKTYAVEGDAQSSVMAMRHAWRAHFNFGRLTFEAESKRTVLFRVEEYPDIPMIHGLMIAGWGVAAARAAGAREAGATVLVRPWRSEGDFSYSIDF